MTKEIIIPIYNATIIIVYMDNIDQAMSKYTDDIGDNEDAMTVWFDTDHRYVVGITKRVYRPEMLTHECVHLAHRIMNNVGIEHSLLGDEAEAYLAGYLSQRISDVICEADEADLYELRYMKNFTL